MTMASFGREIEPALLWDQSTPLHAAFESASPPMQALGRSLAQAAGRGTLFLDEIAELPPTVQTAALRLLQDPGRLRGRLVASTCHDLQAEMAAARFRKDLFYRLAVVEIRVPPLRERAEDILPIARAFVASLAREEGRPPPELGPALERALLHYSWPGNVQELLGILQRVFALSPGSGLDVAALPDRLST